MTIERMKCGNCGGTRATLRAVHDGDRHQLIEIRARCCKCKSVTRFVITLPTIDIEWGKGASGVFCGGWRKDGSR